MIFTTPRSGSTWLMELVTSQPGFKHCNEPLNLRHPDVRRGIGLGDWPALYSREADARVEAYFTDLASGRLKTLNPSPRDRTHRFRTTRTVFKVLHGGEERIQRIADAVNGRVIVLLRHPIPVSLSREVLPRLETFLESDFAGFFDEGERVYARRILSEGTTLDRGVLDWTLQNAVPLRAREPDWLFVTYEQLVLDPRPILDRLVEHLALADPARLYNGLDVPSHTVKKSDAETSELLHGNVDEEKRARELVGRWRRRVDAGEEARAMAVLERFGVDVYRAGRVLPTDAYWIGDPSAEIGGL
ncbi:MAG: hypothetical protein AAGC67_00110 [Myxococcota bacterium]